VGRERGMDRSGSGYEEVAGSCECGNEPLVSTKHGEFLDYLRTSLLLRKTSAQWSFLYIGLKAI
jgi:hypothetical protein